MPALKRKPGTINLVLKGDLNASYFDLVLSWILTYGRYIVILTQIVVLSVFFLRFKLDRDHTDLKEAISQKQAIVESINELETEIRRTQGKLTNIRQTTNKQNLPIQILNFLEEHTPSDTFLYTLSLTSEKISFSAASNGLSSFSYLLAEIQQDKKFSEVTLEDIQRRADGRIEYRINAKINSAAFI